MNPAQQIAPQLSVVIIAAGNSSRLGQAKQLIQYDEKSLLQHSINLAQNVSDTTFCILGFELNKFSNHIKLSKTAIITNPNWALGMGTSIAIGIKNLPQNTDAAMILLCDQYLLTDHDIEQLVKCWKKNPNKLIAAQYFDRKLNSVTIGAPAIFPKSYFLELAQLEKKGAKAILQNNSSELILIQINNAAIDLDTPEDLEKLILSQQENNK